MNESSNFGAGLKMIVFLAVGLVVLCSILVHDTGGIAGFVKIFGGALCVYGFLKPRTGLYILAFFCFYLDFVKKLAVVFGVVNMRTVIEVLAIQMLALGCIWLGTFLQLILFQQRMNRTLFLAAASFLALTGTVMLFFGESGLVGTVQASVNNVGYSAVILVIMAYLQSREEMLRFLDFIFWLAVPWAFYGTIQYFFGFADFEWEYARTFLSPISAGHMLGAEVPRPFGFASGAGGYGVLTLIMSYGAWRFLFTRTHRLVFGAGCLVVFVGLVFSAQRSILLMPFLTGVCYFAFSSRTMTKAFYLGSIGAFLIAVINAGTLMPLLAVFDSRAEFGNDWANRVIRISTFSDRMRGWERLTNPATYTFFGKRWTSNYEKDLGYQGQDYSHDMINTLLNNIGVVGMLIVFWCGFLVLRKAHRLILTMDWGEDRRFMTFLMATLVVFMVTMGVGGNNLSSTPINMVYWTLIGCWFNAWYLAAQKPVTEVETNQGLAVASRRLAMRTPEMKRLHRMRPSRLPGGTGKGVS